MFFRLKKSGERGYMQIVENKRDGAAVRQKGIANAAAPTSGRLRRARLSHRFGGQAHRSSVAHQRARRGRRRRRPVRRSEAERRAAASRHGAGPGIDAVLADLPQEARAHDPGRADRVRRGAASAVRLGIPTRPFPPGGKHPPPPRKDRSPSPPPPHDRPGPGGR